MHIFNARLEIIGINPFVYVPKDILTDIFMKAGKNKGGIPVCGSILDKPFAQTLVRYSGEWRLYINTTMLLHSPRHVGETLRVTLDYDPKDRTVPLHPGLAAVLAQDPAAQVTYEKLSPSRQKEINRYLYNLKTDAAVQGNIDRAVQFLHGKARFAGREIT